MLCSQQQALYRLRREQLLAQLEPDAVVILVGNRQQVRNKNIHYAFRQDHDFYYLTGYAEPDAVAILRPECDAPFVLFNQPKDAHQEVWFAQRTGQVGAVEGYGASLAYDIAELEQRLPELMGQRAHLYLADELGRFSHRLVDWLAQQRRSVKFDQPKIFRHLHSVLPYIHASRVIKDSHELALLRQAVHASVAGHKRLMQVAKPGVTELQLHGEFLAEIARHGCNDVGYGNIIATGNNACCLHYEAYRSTLQDGELLLLDAGGDYQYYTADITRTIPVNGKFSGPQRDLYQLVLASLDAAIAIVRPGLGWQHIYPTAMRVLAEGMLDLGILSGSLDEVLEQQLYAPFTLHKTGHWLGLDVHDVGPYHDDAGNWRTLQSNMLFTIEPGLYFPKDCRAVAPQWRGMGVRVEDDILVTPQGCENLSAGAPRTVEQIESLMQGKD
ncbi:aminopeptidase P N-terminal domain-containing protein [Bowmanella yangjiangensis]|uniref:Xaa-Pro aminopeptidase n=1 Tax=Bowmanella yangjiangensis TaxID=2811230 RepID=A0ABS3CRM1_9ALTE|nr:aminopeptidase P N-terminal domain-containing protein [Bowmanella yangjiangensis]MBN7819758.1 aminopeptidase P N-terminal domain-containing protein [Bowmanella yangjiangensis]